MTRPSIPYPDLEADIEARMQPEAQPRDRWFWLRVIFYAGAAVCAKAGAIAAFVLMSPVIVGIWVCRRVKR
jgi:hypothetical protein